MSHRPAFLLVLLVRIFKWNQFSNPLGNAGLDRLRLLRVERFHIIHGPRYSRRIRDLGATTLIYQAAAFISKSLKFHENKRKKTET